MAKIIAVANQKGGVAKTTTTQNLAVSLAEKGKKVLILDFDSQASLTIAVGLEPEHYEESCIVQAISDPHVKNSNYKPIQECIVKTPDDKVWLVPSIIDLADEEWQMFSRLQREVILKNAIAPVVDQFDYILIDCPPALGILTINALACADSILIPSSTEYLSYRGLKNLKKTIGQIQASVNKDLNILGVIATRHKRTTRNKEILELTMKKFPVIAVIKELADAVDGIYEGKSVVDQVPNSEVSVVYNRIANMILENNFPTIDEWQWNEEKENRGEI